MLLFTVLVNRPEVALRQLVYCSHFHHLVVIHLFQTLNGFTNCLFIEAVVEQRHLNVDGSIQLAD